MDIMTRIIKNCLRRKHIVYNLNNHRVSLVQKKQKIREYSRKREQQLQVPKTAMILACLRDRIKAPIVVA